jgi:hypothetical protein
MADKQKYVGVVEIKQPNGEYFYVEILKEDNLLITGTFTNTIFLRDEWTVDINDYYSLQEALEDLYDMLYDAAMQEVAAA